MLLLVTPGFASEVAGVSANASGASSEEPISAVARYLFNMSSLHHQKSVMLKTFQTARRSPSWVICPAERCRFHHAEGHTGGTRSRQTANCASVRSRWLQGTFD